MVPKLSQVRSWVHNKPHGDRLTASFKSKHDCEKQIKVFRNIQHILGGLRSNVCVVSKFEGRRDNQEVNKPVEPLVFGHVVNGPPELCVLVEHIQRHFRVDANVVLLVFLLVLLVDNKPVLSADLNNLVLIQILYVLVLVIINLHPNHL